MTKLAITDGETTLPIDGASISVEIDRELTIVLADGWIHKHIVTQRMHTAECESNWIGNPWDNPCICNKESTDETA